MPKIQTWDNLPAGVRQHLADRMRDRSISLEDLNQLRLWVESKPEVPDGDWYKDFGSFKICGQGRFPKTFLSRGQSGVGRVNSVGAASCSRRAASRDSHSKIWFQLRIVRDATCPPRPSTCRVGGGRLVKRIIQVPIFRGEKQYVAECLDLPIVTQAQTLDDLASNIREAVSLHLDGEDLSELGIAPNPTILASFELDAVA